MSIISLFPNLLRFLKDVAVKSMFLLLVSYESCRA